MINRWRLWMAAAMLLLTGFVGVPLVDAATAAAPAQQQSADRTGMNSPEAIMQQFDDGDEVSPQRKITTERKHQILFLMGAALLLLLLITGGLGVAMIAFGKNVFTAHMIFAGLSITLAIVHSATAIAWFWPW